MKTLILFQSKYGTVQRCADLVAQLLPGTEIISLDQFSGDLTGYQQIIVGTSVHMGKFQMSILKFLQKQRSALEGKRVALFYCCMTPEPECLKYIDDNLSKPLQKLFHTISCFGGAIEYGKMNPVYRFVMKQVTKKNGMGSGDLDRISMEKIEQFVAALNSDQEDQNGENK